MNQPKFMKDFLASIVVFLVALPLCLGIAIASGVPPAAGLITGIVGGLVVGAIGGAPLQVSGPAAGLAVIVFELVREHGISMLGPILIVAGLIQLVAGLLKFGQWFRAMSPAVIYGMLAGIGVLILSAQFHVMLDDKPKPSGLQNLLSIPAAIFQGIFPLDGSKHELAALVGILTIVSLLAWEKFRPKSLRFVPGALVGVMVGTVSAAIFRWPVQRVSVPANLWDAVRFPTTVDWQHMLDPALLLSAAALAFVASAETLLSAAAVDQMHTGPRTNYDRELSAQGIGNMLCGFLGSLPMTGVIVRSSANVQAGAESRRSAIMHGLWILSFVSVLPWVLRLVPVCSLAGILVYTGYKLINPANLRKLAQYGPMPLAICFATLIGIVVTDLLTGVLIGLGLSFVKVFYKTVRLKLVLDHDEQRRIARLSLEGAATFLSIPRLTRILEGLPPATELHVQVSRLSYIDHACMELLSNWEKQNAATGSRLVVEWNALVKRYNLDTEEAAA